MDPHGAASSLDMMDPHGGLHHHHGHHPASSSLRHHHISPPNSLARLSDSEISDVDENGLPRSHLPHPYGGAGGGLPGDPYGYGAGPPSRRYESLPALNRTPSLPQSYSLDYSVATPTSRPTRPPRMRSFDEAADSGRWRIGSQGTPLAQGRASAAHTPLLRSAVSQEQGLDHLERERRRRMLFSAAATGVSAFSLSSARRRNLSVSAQSVLLPSTPHSLDQDPSNRYARLDHSSLRDPYLTTTPELRTSSFSFLSVSPPSFSTPFSQNRTDLRRHRCRRCRTLVLHRSIIHKATSIT